MHAQDDHLRAAKQLGHRKCARRHASCQTSLRRTPHPERGAALAKPATVPSIWEGKKMYDTMLRQGTYFTYPGPHRRKVAHVFSKETEKNLEF